MTQYEQVFVCYILIRVVERKNIWLLALLIAILTLIVTEGRITRKIVYEIFVISKSQDFLGDFWSFLTNF